MRATKRGRATTEAAHASSAGANSHMRSGSEDACCVGGGPRTNPSGGGAGKNKKNTGGNSVSSKGRRGSTDAGGRGATATVQRRSSSVASAVGGRGGRGSGAGGAKRSPKDEEKEGKHSSEGNDKGEAKEKVAESGSSSSASGSEERPASGGKASLAVPQSGWDRGGRSRSCSNEGRRGSGGGRGGSGESRNSSRARSAWGGNGAGGGHAAGDEDHEETLTCPLCLEEMDETDRGLFPCECGYQLCLWCLHHIRERLGNKCPACRREYDEKKFKFNEERVNELKRMIGRHKGRDKAQQHPHSSSSPPPHVHSHGTGRNAASGSGSNASSQSATSVSSAGISNTGNKGGSSSGFFGVSNSAGVTGGGTGGGVGFSSSGTGCSPPMNAGDLKDVRVIQRSLVYVIGIPPSIAKKEILKRPEFFGQYGKVVHMVVNKSQGYNSAWGGPSYAVYVTYSNSREAVEAIQNIDGAVFEGRTLKASFGTTKYCSYFLKGIKCQNPDCFYLHTMGSDKDSFTKEAMISAKHEFLDLTLPTGEGAKKAAAAATGSGAPSSFGVVPAGGGERTGGGHTSGSNVDEGPEKRVLSNKGKSEGGAKSPRADMTVNTADDSFQTQNGEGWWGGAASPGPGLSVHSCASKRRSSTRASGPYRRSSRGGGRPSTAEHGESNGSLVSGGQTTAVSAGGGEGGGNFRGGGAVDREGRRGQQAATSSGWASSTVGGATSWASVAAGSAKLHSSTSTVGPCQNGGTGSSVTAAKVVLAGGGAVGSRSSPSAEGAALKDEAKKLRGPRGETPSPSRRKEGKEGEQSSTSGSVATAGDTAGPELSCVSPVPGSEQKEEGEGDRKEKRNGSFSDLSVREGHGNREEGREEEPSRETSGEAHTGGTENGLSGTALDGETDEGERNADLSVFPPAPSGVVAFPALTTTSDRGPIDGRRGPHPLPPLDDQVEGERRRADTGSSRGPPNPPSQPLGGIAASGGQLLYGSSVLPGPSPSSSSSLCSAPPLLCLDQQQRASPGPAGPHAGALPPPHLNLRGSHPYQPTSSPSHDSTVVHQGFCCSRSSGSVVAPGGPRSTPRLQQAPPVPSSSYGFPSSVSSSTTNSPGTFLPNTLPPSPCLHGNGAAAGTSSNSSTNFASSPGIVGARPVGLQGQHFSLHASSVAAAANQQPPLLPLPPAAFQQQGTVGQSGRMGSAGSGAGGVGSAPWSPVASFTSISNTSGHVHHHNHAGQMPAHTANHTNAMAGVGSPAPHPPPSAPGPPPLHGSQGAASCGVGLSGASSSFGAPGLLSASHQHQQSRFFPCGSRAGGTGVSSQAVASGRSGLLPGMGPGMAADQGGLEEQGVGLGVGGGPLGQGEDEKEDEEELFEVPGLDDALDEMLPVSALSACMARRNLDYDGPTGPLLSGGFSSLCGSGGMADSDSRKEGILSRTDEGGSVGVSYSAAVGSVLSSLDRQQRPSFGMRTGGFPEIPSSHFPSLHSTVGGGYAGEGGCGESGVSRGPATSAADYGPVGEAMSGQAGPTNREVRWGHEEQSRPAQPAPTALMWLRQLQQTAGQGSEAREQQSPAVPGCGQFYPMCATNSSDSAAGRVSSTSAQHLLELLRPLSASPDGAAAAARVIANAACFQSPGVSGDSIKRPPPPAIPRPPSRFYYVPSSVPFMGGGSTAASHAEMTFGPGVGISLPSEDSTACSGSRDFRDSKGGGGTADSSSSSHRRTNSATAGLLPRAGCGPARPLTGGSSITGQQLLLQMQQHRLASSAASGDVAGHQAVSGEPGPHPQNQSDGQCPQMQGWFETGLGQNSCASSSPAPNLASAFPRLHYGSQPSNSKEGGEVGNGAGHIKTDRTAVATSQGPPPSGNPAAACLAFSDGGGRVPKQRSGTWVSPPDNTENGLISSGPRFPEGSNRSSFTSQGSGESNASNASNNAVAFFLSLMPNANVNIVGPGATTSSFHRSFSGNSGGVTGPAGGRHPPAQKTGCSVGGAGGSVGSEEGGDLSQHDSNVPGGGKAAGAQGGLGNQRVSAEDHKGKNFETESVGTNKNGPPLSDARGPSEPDEQEATGSSLRWPSSAFPPLSSHNSEGSSNTSKRSSVASSRRVSGGESASVNHSQNATEANKWPGGGNTSGTGPGSVRGGSGGTSRSQGGAGSSRGSGGTPGARGGSNAEKPSVFSAFSSFSSSSSAFASSSFFSTMPSHTGQHAPLLGTSLKNDDGRRGSGHSEKGTESESPKKASAGASKDVVASRGSSVAAGCGEETPAACKQKSPRREVDATKADGRQPSKAAQSPDSKKSGQKRRTSEGAARSRGKVSGSS
ncbi:rna recognition motif protein [Cystoisospora suis]|uniref:Rna recognition motif protein n=1 Tax=Cystoisospora suis TaxID=483139 RepID=A0A2C6LBQ1_9APIC|nr:rna recognition motif protein [Cystoisospora suis]